MVACGVGRHGLAAAIAWAATLLATGCAPPEPPRLVALLGCGLEVPDGEDAAFTSLRVQARGDFPLDDDLEVRVSSSAERLAADPGDIAGVTVEGLLGDSVTAVGRTARVHGTGELPVYFAPEDQWCALTSAVPFRERAVLTVGEDGDVLLVGGRDADGLIIDDLVHLRDDDATIVTLPDALPVPSTGHTVHEIAPRHFVIVGGAGPNRTAIASVVHVELQGGDASVSEPVALAAPAGIPVRRAYHGGATLPDGRILVVGGCTGLGNQSECVPEPETDFTPATVLSSSYTLAFDGVDPAPRVEAGPPLVRARYDHQLHVARDGVVFAVGGRDVHGGAVLWPERLLPGADAFEDYGPSGLAVALDTPCPDVTPPDPDEEPPLPDLLIEGSALLEGGLLVLAMRDGTLRFVSDTEIGCFPAWCVHGAPCFAASPPIDEDDPVQASMRAARSLLALPGERVLADGFLLPVAGVGSSGFDARDLSRPTIDNPLPPPGQRTGAAVAVLADGSVLVAGGRDAIDGAPALPFFVRLRPQLDGPDERLPAIDELDVGSLVSRQPERVLLDSADAQGNPQRVRLISDGTSSSESFPAVRMRARAFRSAKFRFEVRLERDATGPDEDARPHIVLERGAVAATSIRLGPSAITRFLRDESGEVSQASCGPVDLDFAEPVQLRIDVSPEAIRIRVDGREVAQCPGDGEVPAAIGVGVSGLGTIAASQMRLTRI
jgi:hypothetical protein